MSVVKWIRVGLIGLCLAGCQSAQTINDAGEEPNRIASINTLLGIQYMKSGENEIALQKLQRALSADPNYADAHNALGLLYGQLGQNDKADESFRTAIRLATNNSNALNNYGQFLCHTGRNEEGQKMFLEAVKNPLYRTPAVAYSNAGTCALGSGDLEAAETHLREALQIDPQLAQALLQMAQVSYDKKRYLPARAYLQRYLEVADRSAKALWLGIQIERVLGDKDAVASYSLRLGTTYPDSKEAMLMRESQSP